MKVFINRKIVEGSWGGGNHFVRAFHNIAPKFGMDVTSDANDLHTVDAILIIGIDPDNTGVGAYEAFIARRSLPNQPKIVARINENDARKGTTGVDEMMMNLVHHSDGAVYVSNWLKDYYDERWLVPSMRQSHDNAAVIINGVDKEIFRIYGGIKIFDHVELCVRAHHWSSHVLKGFDFYNLIDEFADKNDWCKFHYIGRDRRTFKGKNTIITPACHGKVLGHALGNQTSLYEIYISASRHDPGPNHCIEAIACGLETYAHVDGGGAVEFAGADHTFFSFDELQKIMERSLAGEYHPNDFVPPTWEDCISKYVEYIRRVVEG